jgi:hypothetical protein
VRCHRRIISATCRRNSWDGGLTCAVTIVAPWPAELTRARQWTRDRGWRNWPQLFGQYVIPTERDLARVPHLRAQLTVEAPIPIDDLPCTPEHRDDRVEHAARHAVVVIVRELNELLGPMLSQLDSDAPTVGSARSDRTGFGLATGQAARTEALVPDVASMPHSRQVDEHLTVGRVAELAGNRSHTAPL